MRDHKNPFADRLERRTGGGAGGMSLDVLVTPDRYLIEVDLPGVELDDIEVAIDGNELTIRAVRMRGARRPRRRTTRFSSASSASSTERSRCPGCSAV